LLRPIRQILGQKHVRNPYAVVAIGFLRAADGHAREHERAEKDRRRSTYESESRRRHANPPGGRRSKTKSEPAASGIDSCGDSGDSGVETSGSARAARSYSGMARSGWLDEVPLCVVVRYSTTGIDHGFPTRDRFWTQDLAGEGRFLYSPSAARNLFSRNG
jgi:hypothetical protein